VGERTLNAERRMGSLKSASRKDYRIESISW